MVALLHVRANDLKYEPAFDGLRALAIIFVFLVHAWESAFPGGWAGVDIFFVLSGYLITTLLTNELSETGTIDYRNFYIRRVLRLWPAFAVFLLVVVLEMSVRAPNIWSFGAVGLSAVYLMNWNRAFVWWSQHNLGHTWSLAMEEQFYLLWPALLVFIFSRRAICCVLAMIIAMVTWRCFLALDGADPERTYNGFDTHGDALLIGCLLALLVRRNPDLTIKIERDVARCERWPLSNSFAFASSKCSYADCGTFYYGFAIGCNDSKFAA